MLEANQVTLVGDVIADSVMRDQLPSGGQCLIFVLRTVEQWFKRGGERSEHYEYHQVVLRDSSSYRMMSKHGSKIQGGCRLIVTGRLRYRAVRAATGEVVGRDCEIDADDVAVLAAPSAPKWQKLQQHAVRTQRGQEVGQQILEGIAAAERSLQTASNEDEVRSYPSEHERSA